MPDNRNFDFLGLGGNFGFRYILHLLTRFRGLRFSCFDVCSFQSESFKDCFENVVHPAPMFGGDRKQLSNSQAMEFVGERLLFVAVNLIDCKKQWLAAAKQQTGEVEIGCCEFAASVDYQNYGVSLLQ